MEAAPNVKNIFALMNNPSDADRKIIEKAFTFAQNAHDNQKRNSGEKYFNHVYETALSLAEFGMGPKAIAAGLLHDTVEDAEVTEGQIQEAFGNEILALVMGVTKLGTLRYRGVARHAESLRKLLVASSHDPRVIIIKLADRLHNMRTLAHVPPAKQRRIALETLEIYARVADRLGMGRLRGELEDLAFPYLYPKEYEKVKELLKQKSKENEQHLEKVHKSLKKLLAQEQFVDFQTEYRLKRLYSLYKKLERKEWDISKIHDISALRVIVPTVNDCYRVLGIIHGSWRPLPGKIKDYIAFEKPNGYRSLHTTIFTGDGGIVEIQIRTPRMHREAEYGIASHVSYKETDSPNETGTHKNNVWWFSGSLPKIMRNKEQRNGAEKEEIGARFMNLSVPQWIKQIAETHESAAESEEFLRTLKTDFFTHRVFAFTPKGDVIDLPVDSTPIDFAYAIHSDVGDHIAGAKVNGKLVSLDTTLNNGDIVAIETKPSSKPSQKWLAMAKTSLAQRRIRTSLQKDTKTKKQ